MISLDHFDEAERVARRLASLCDDADIPTFSVIQFTEELPGFASFHWDDSEFALWVVLTTNDFDDFTSEKLRALWEEDAVLAEAANERFATAISN